MVYGTEILTENLKFIADALGGKGHPKEVLRNYFLNDFFANQMLPINLDDGVKHNYALFQDILAKIK